MENSWNVIFSFKFYLNLIFLILTWSKGCTVSSATGRTKFKITATKLYVPVVTLWTEDNVKLLKQL